MREMTRHERLLAATYKKTADKLPFFHYWRHCDFGWAERKCRNMGMGITWERPAHVEKIHGVEITTTQKEIDGKTVFRRTYNTPVGSVYEEFKNAPGTGSWKSNRGWLDSTPWYVSRLIKHPEDYAVMKYIVQNTEYTADYFPVEQAMEWLGDDGLVTVRLPHSPMQMLMIHWVGSEGGRFFFHHEDYPDMVEDLYQAVCKSREPLYKIAANSPAPIIRSGDNIDAILVNPILFKAYFLPEYERQAAVFHDRNKLMAVHMDGRLHALKDMIAASSIDIIEAFHPPPMGDLSIQDALSVWKDKIIWVGFPGSIYTLGPEATAVYTLDLIKQIGTGERIAIAMSTENLVSNENLIAVSSILAQAALPLSEEKARKIEKSVHL